MTQDELKQILFYCSITGYFTWLVSKRGINKGDRAGSTNNLTRYRTIKIKGKLYLEHRLAWLYVHGVMPTDTIDHKNRIRDDNRIDNLRLATYSENQQNRSKNKNNTSGFVGVSLHKASGKWLAMIKINKKNKNLGYFDTPELASQAYESAKYKYHTFQPFI